MTDYELIQLLKTDPNKGMTNLMHDYMGFVFSIVKGILSDICDTSEIEDCVTDVFLKFQVGLLNFKADASIKTYLGIIARNTALNYARNRITYFSTDKDDFLLEISDGKDFVDEIAEKDLLERIFREITEMGHPDSDILFRKYYLGQSSKYIAERLGISVSNVDTRSHRSVEKLKKKFGGEIQ